TCGAKRRFLTPRSARSADAPSARCGANGGCGARATSCTGTTSMANAPRSRPRSRSTPEAGCVPPSHPTTPKPSSGSSPSISLQADHLEGPVERHGAGDVADAGWVPAGSAEWWDAVGGEAVGDGSEGPSGGHVVGDAVADVVREEGWFDGSQSSAVALGVGFADPFADAAAFPCGDRHHDVGDELAGRGGGVDAEVEGDEGPAVFAGPAEHGAEVDDGAGEAVELGHDQDVGVAPVEPVKHGSEGGAAAQGRAADAGVGGHLEELPSPMGGLSFDRGPLGVHAEAGFDLLAGADPGVADGPPRAVCGVVGLGQRVSWVVGCSGLGPTLNTTLRTDP